MKLLKRLYKHYCATIWLVGAAVCFSVGVQPNEPLISHITVFLFPITTFFYENLMRKTLMAQKGEPNEKKHNGKSFTSP